jgi:hypothetical protein
VHPACFGCDQSVGKGLVSLHLDSPSTDSSFEEDVDYLLLIPPIYASVVAHWWVVAFNNLLNDKLLLICTFLLMITYYLNRRGIVC